MDIFNVLTQIFGNCAGGTCPSQAAQAATEAATTVTAATGAMGGFSGLMGLLCRLFGLGC